MSKTLEQLFVKASQKGESNKNGRITEYDFGHTYVSDLQEQWHVIDNGIHFELRHWGTTILIVENSKVTDVYGQSNSDRDALNQAFNWLGIEEHAHFYPSRDTLEIHQNGTEELLQTV